MQPSTTLQALVRALDALDEPTSAQGTWPLAKDVVVTLANGDRRAASQAGFVDWMAAHAEVAPFGDGKQTRVDSAVRHTLRLVDRGASVVSGFDVDTTEIARKLAPRAHVTATLVDVLVYPAGGKFARHKDTPTRPDLLGTLVVGLPVAHEGGAMVLEDGEQRVVADWSRPSRTPRTVPWVALYGDVDHRIETVTEGARVTAVYALTVVHNDAAPLERVATVREALRAVLADHELLPSGGDLVIPCARQVIASTTPDAPLELRGLRGLDRDLVDLFVSEGLNVVLRPCIGVVAADAGGRASSQFEQIGADLMCAERLAKPIPKVARDGFAEMVTFARRAVFDDGEGETDDATTLAKYLHRSKREEVWATRRRAAGTRIHEALFSEDGHFGNEHFEAHIYSLAALEVSIGPLAERGVTLPDPPAAVDARRVRHAKFGDGSVLAEVDDGKSATLEIRFDSGETKKVLGRFVQTID
jgi:hypothetical protein